MGKVKNAFHDEICAAEPLEDRGEPPEHRWDDPATIAAMRELYHASGYIKCLLNEGETPDENDIEQLSDALFTAGEVTGWRAEFEAASARALAQFMEAP